MTTQEKLRASLSSACDFLAKALGHAMPLPVQRMTGIEKMLTHFYVARRICASAVTCLH
jgi:hypothetical protein